MVCLSCLGKMSHCIVRAYKQKCLCVKYTCHPVCPPLSVIKSLMHCLFFIVVCFKFVKFSPNVCMLVVLAVKLGHRNVSACRKKFKVNISVSNTTNSRAATIRLGIFKHTIQQEVSGGLLSQKILEAMRLPDRFFGAMWCFLEARHIYKYLPFVPIVAYSTAASSSSSPQTENNFRGQYEPLISFCVWTHICRLLSLVVSVKCPVVLSGHINVCVCTAYTHLSSWACHQNHQFSKGPWGVSLFFFFLVFLCHILVPAFMFPLHVLVFVHHSW